MLNNDFKKYRFCIAVEKNSASDLAEFLSKIVVPCDVVSVYYADKKHVAILNPSRSLVRPRVTKKSPRDTNKEHKES